VKSEAEAKLVVVQIMNVHFHVVCVCVSVGPAVAEQAAAGCQVQRPACQDQSPAAGSHVSYAAVRRAAVGHRGDSEQGDPPHTGVRRRAQQQGLPVSGPCRHGAGTNGDAGHVEERLVSQTAATFLQ